MAITYTPIATTTLGSPAATFTFSSIPSTYTDLIIVMNGNLTSTSAVYVQFNGDTGANYSDTYLQGGSGGATSGRDSTAYVFGYLSTGNNATAIANFMNYSNTNTYKTILSRTGDMNNVYAYVSLWRSTAAINAIKLLMGGPSFAAGTTFTLYGIKAA